MRQSRFWAVPAVALLLAACGGGGSNGGNYSTGPGTGGNNPGGTPNPNTVSVTNDAFAPNNITVPANTTVTWNWDSCTGDPGGYGGYGTCVAHNVTFDDGSNISSGSQSSGTFSRTFTASGTYKYHCAIHGSAMSGQVVVQ